MTLNAPVVFLPVLSPRMGKVDDQNKLDQDEKEGATQSKVHPRGAKASVRNEERAKHPRKEQKELQPPKSILKMRPLKS